MAWRFYNCNINNKSAQVLIDDRFYKKEPVNELPLLSWVGVYCRLLSGESFNDPKETEILDEIEDNLFRLCSDYGNGYAVYTHRIVTYGIREYYIYHGDKAELDRAFSAIRSLYPEYKIETETTLDDKWNEYKKYIGE